MQKSTQQPTLLSQWKLSYNPRELDELFLKFLTDKEFKTGFEMEQYLHHKKNGIKLPSNLIIQTSQELELFLIQHFKISHNLPVCELNLSTIKKNFIQKTTFQKYKSEQVPTDWEREYNFTTQNEFVFDVLTNANDAEVMIAMEKYSAFAMFTEIGKKKHKHDSIFHLPKSVNQKDDFLSVREHNGLEIVSTIEKVERADFNLTDSLPKKDVIDWSLNYCLYCHTRFKDSCSKGLHAGLSSEKNGCPLRQDISESIFLKKENFHIGSLAAIMKENPLCILTGRRICQNCEEACIFQKQEAVDVQSIETQILMDVLQMPFGVEIYNLLLWWNPLETSHTTAPIGNLKKANVLVAGLGPAGLFASYLFSKHGANVLGVDALNVEIPQKIWDISQNLVKDSSSILNQPLSQRMPSGIGGVMEYGITVRWNKNFLDLAIGLILRRKNIHFEGSVRIGGLLNGKDISEMGFHHTALCIGSAKPQVPKITGIFEKFSLTAGVMMASDFLMSLHINRESDYLSSVINPPVYILGCGLTAIDTACEVRALLKKYGLEVDVKILYYQSAIESSSYKINHFEFKKALEEGIEIIQNVTIVEVIKNDGVISALLLQNGVKLSCKLLILAIGIRPNLEHTTEFATENTSLFGDCNLKYTGSVVNALASVKDGIGDSIAKMKGGIKREKCNDVPKYSELFVKTISISQVDSHTNLFQIIIHSPILAKKSKTGNVLKLQVMYHSSIALTIAKVSGDSLILFIENINKETEFLIDAIMQNKIVHVNGINCSSFPLIPIDCTAITSTKANLVFAELLQNHNVISPEEFLRECDGQSGNKKYFIAVEDETLLEQILEKCQSIGAESQIFLYNKMNCMLGGICGRCIRPDGTYACVDNVITLHPHPTSNLNENV